MLLAEGFCLFEPHDHERCGIGVGQGTFLGNDSCRKQAVLYGIAYSRVDGVGILLAVAIVEVAIVARSCHGCIAQVEHGQDFVVLRQRILDRLVDADFPLLVLRAHSLHDNLAANVYHVVADALAVEQLRHGIASVALGNGAAIEHSAAVGLLYAIAVKAYLLVANELAQGVDCGRVNPGALLESESPCVDERCNGYVECSAGLPGNGHGHVEYVVEHRVGCDILVAVYVADD